MTHRVLAELARRELFAEIVCQLRPVELIIAVLRLQGHTDAEIAELLGVSRPAVTKRMRRAQRRIARDLPEAAELLAGRVRRRTS